MQTMHTPGPWTVEGPVFNSKSPSRHIRAGLNGYPAHAFGQSGAEAEGNARLIAAAPEMLAALDGLLREFGRDREGLDPEISGHARLIAAYAVLDKATRD